MRKIILLTSTLALLGFGLGGANAYNASDAFGPSEQNDLPVSVKQIQPDSSDSALITSSTGTGSVTFGYPVREKFGSSNQVYWGYNASDEFGFSSQNDLPVR